jgi:hypothetical protein
LQNGIIAAIAAAALSAAACSVIAVSAGGYWFASHLV